MKTNRVRRLAARQTFVLATLAFSILFVPPAAAESLDEFRGRVAAAYSADDKIKALRALFYFRGVDAETLARYDERLIPRVLGKYDSPTIAFDQLPADFDPLQVLDGYEYRPNLRPIGYLVLNGRTRVPFGVHMGRYYFPGVLRKAVNPNAPPDKTLQMMVVGFADPPVEFEGYCDIMQSNRKLRRLVLTNNGHGNRTLVVRAQRIESCRVTNTSGRGSLSLRLTENDAEFFKSQVEAPETTITYHR
jgi:hypothetical protein